MIISTLWALQKAIHHQLTHFPALNVLLSGRIYDAVPGDTVFPYIVIGADTMRRWDTKSYSGSNLTLSLHVWAQEAGRSMVKKIMMHMEEALLEVPLELENHHLVMLSTEFVQSYMEKDNQTAHGIMRLRALTHQAYGG